MEKRAKPSLDDSKVAPLEKRKICRLDIFGYPVTAVLWLLGKEGWDVEAAHLAVTTFANNYDLSIGTSRAQVMAGRKGKRGDPAPLTKAQLQKLAVCAE